MKAFRFPLERALHWRRTQLEIEKAASQRLATQRIALDRAMTALADERSSAEITIARAGVIESCDLVTMSGFQVRIARQNAALGERRKSLDTEAAAQMAKTTEAQKRVRLLERLREKRLAAWTAEMEAEQECFAAEAWLGRWPMLKQGVEESSGVDASRSPA